MRKLISPHDGAGGRAAPRARVPPLRPPRQPQPAQQRHLACACAGAAAGGRRDLLRRCRAARHRGAPAGGFGAGGLGDGARASRRRATSRPSNRRPISITCSSGPASRRRASGCPYDEKAEQTMREDFLRLWGTNFLEDLRIEVTDYTFSNGVVGKLVTYHMEERERVKIVDYERQQADRSHEDRRAAARARHRAAARLVRRRRRRSAASRPCCAR